MEHRQAAHRRIGRFGGRVLAACGWPFTTTWPIRRAAIPIARESTRLWCAAVSGAQTSLDPQQMKEWTPNSRYGGHAFGFMDPNDIKTRDTRFAEFLGDREKILPWIKEYSPIEHVTADDPPIYMIYSHAARARPGPEGPDAHRQLWREAAGETARPRRRVRTGLSRRAGREAQAIDGLSHRETEGGEAVNLAVFRSEPIGQTSRLAVILPGDAYFFVSNCTMKSMICLLSRARGDIRVLAAMVPSLPMTKVHRAAVTARWS